MSMQVNDQRPRRAVRERKQVSLLRAVENADERLLRG
jgi:hypothetical protein